MKMTDEDYLHFLKSEAESSYQYTSGQMAEDRERALREYLRMPYGNEEEGHSSVIASDVFDSVEGMLPDVVDVFVSTDEAVRFDPVGPEDVEGAEQATNACNYVFYKQNNGFLILYTAAKDALLMKTGGVKWYWEEKRTPNFQTMRGTEMQLAVHLATNPGTEVVSKEDGEPMPDPMTGQLVPTLIVKLKTVEKKGKVRVESIPPDELRVSRRHNSILLDECSYVAHVVKKSWSDIRQMGFDVTVDDVRAAQDDGQVMEDAELRDTYMDGQYPWQRQDDRGSQDESLTEGWLREEYVLADRDGDGIAERRRVIRLGDKILEDEECSHVQIAAWTPYILTHRFAGISVADLVSDFQKINTDIWRQSLDNLFLANNQETVVLTDANGNPKANIDDLLNRRAGGVIRESVPGAVRPYVDSWRGVEVTPMLEMVQTAKEQRTGYMRYMDGLDGTALKKTATEVATSSNNRQKRMKLMARVMAEALVAPMFRGIFKTLTDYCMEKVSFRLHGKFVQYDPQEWRDGYDMTINVGIGAGDKLQQMQMIGGIEQAQAVIVQAGGMGKLISPKNLYNLQKRKVELAGFKDAGEFFTDPESVPDQPQEPPPPDPKVQLEGAKLQQAAQEHQDSMQMEAQKLTAEQAFEAEQRERDRMLQVHLKQMELAARQSETPEEPEEQSEEEQVQLQMLAQIGQTVEALAQMLVKSKTEPAQLVRDEMGNAVAVQTPFGQRAIVRDESGRVSGLQPLQ